MGFFSSVKDIGKKVAGTVTEIAEANDEDAKRNASGGNLQVNFNGRGLI